MSIKTSTSTNLLNLRDPSNLADFGSKYSEIAIQIVKELRQCSLGQSGWRRFEKICKKIILFAFEPCFYPFGKIEEQKYSWNKTSRLDYRIPNNTRNDRISNFWHEVKTLYHSHNIVVECKNLTSFLTREEIVQAAGYSWFSNGRFRIIFSRKGIDEKGLRILQEQFQTEQKLILVFNQDDLIDLIKSRVDNIEPEIVLCNLRSRVFSNI